MHIRYTITIVVVVVVVVVYFHYKLVDNEDAAWAIITFQWQARGLGI